MMELPRSAVHAGEWPERTALPCGSTALPRGTGLSLSNSQIGQLPLVL
jgi:hypothetical protein